MTFPNSPPIFHPTRFLKHCLGLGCNAPSPAEILSRIVPAFFVPLKTEIDTPQLPDFFYLKAYSAIYEIQLLFLKTCTGQVLAILYAYMENIA